MSETHTHPVLVVLCGIPASGKSTFANHLKVEEGVEWVNRDKIRSLFGEYSLAKEVEVRRIVEGLVKGHLLDGRIVLVDANHVTVAQRAQVLQWERDLAVVGRRSARVILYFGMSADLAACIRRDDERKHRGQAVGETVVRSQHEQLIEPDNSVERAYVWMIRDDTNPHAILKDLRELGKGAG